MSVTTPRWKRRVVSAAALAGIGLSAACVPSGGPGDISHLSRWTNASFNVAERNTTVEVAAGEDDPAGAGMQRKLVIKVNQSFCDDTTLVTRALEGSSSTFLGYVGTPDGNASVLGSASLSGTETRTAAGPGCAAPVSVSTSAPVSVGASLSLVVQGTGEQVSYSREDGGEYLYQDASATGWLKLDGGSQGNFSFGSSQAADTWLWQGYWADATGIDVPSLIPV